MALAPAASLTPSTGINWHSGQGQVKEQVGYGISFLSVPQSSATFAEHQLTLHRSPAAASPGEAQTCFQAAFGVSVPRPFFLASFRFFFSLLNLHLLPHHQ